MQPHPAYVEPRDVPRALCMLGKPSANQASFPAQSGELINHIRNWTMFHLKNVFCFIDAKGKSYGGSSCGLNDKTINI